MHHASDSKHAFHGDDSKPLAESVLPLGDDNRAVMTQIWPEGSAVYLGHFGLHGEFVATSGHFRTFRSSDLLRDK